MTRQVGSLRVVDPRSWQAGGAVRDEVEILIEERAMAVIRDEAVRHNRLWQQWVPGSLLRGLKEGLPSSECQKALDELLELCRSQLVEGHRRPMVLLLQSGHRTAWHALTPSGMIGLVQKVGNQIRLVGCRFPNFLTVHYGSAKKWWKIVAKALLWRYGFIDDQSGQLFAINRKGGIMVYFVTPKTWGFATEIPQMPWRGRLGNWYEEDTPQCVPSIQLWKRKKTS
ncbi:MAG: hypothetical protein KatS3mg109_0497 [Pirellulaceae bacterium]|nr:MAG: hypothetical protein KatS3mg109_0497 [Pirellulaceae bacterium]